MTELPTGDRSFATHRRRQFLKVSAAALFGLALSTCGRRLGNVQSPTTSAVSSASDKLYVYTWAQYTDKELLNSFTAKTGIQVVADVYD